MTIPRYPWRVWLSECFLSPRPEEGNGRLRGKLPGRWPNTKLRPGQKVSVKAARFSPLQLPLLSNSVFQNSRWVYCLSPPYSCQPYTGIVLLQGILLFQNLLSMVTSFLEVSLIYSLSRQYFGGFLHRSQQASLLYTQP